MSKKKEHESITELRAMAKKLNSKLYKFNKKASDTMKTLSGLERKRPPTEDREVFPTA